MGSFSVRTRLHASVASASSEPCMRLDMRVLPLARMTYSPLRRISVMSSPSGVRVRPSNSQGFMSARPKGVR